MDPTINKVTEQTDEPDLELVEFGDVSEETRGSIWGSHFVGGLGTKPP